MGVEEVARLLEAGRFREIAAADLDAFVERMVVIADESESAANRADALRLIQLAADAVRARGAAAPAATTRISGEIGGGSSTAGLIVGGLAVVAVVGMVGYLAFRRK